MLDAAARCTPRVDPRLRWLLGADPAKARHGGMALLAVAAVLLGASMGAGDNPSVAAAVLVVPAFAAVLYAAWNGGPLLALVASQGGIVLRAAGEAPVVAQAWFPLLLVPAALAAFGIGARRSHRLLGGPPPLGEGALGGGLLVAWALVVLFAAWAMTLPESALGPRVWGNPAWLGPVRTFVVWGPALVAIAWAISRRGPVVAFALATAHLWAGYLGMWGEGPRSAALHLGEVLLPPEMVPLRAAAMLGLGVAAVVLAMAFEPAWPWLPYRQRARGQQV
jgi:hypothetical protein